MEYVMTNILSADADRAFSPEIKRDIWMKIGAVLGLSAAAVTTAGVAFASTGTSVAGVAGASKLMTVVVAVGTSAAAIFATASALLGPVSDYYNIPTQPLQESMDAVEVHQPFRRLPEVVILPEEPARFQESRADLLLEQDVLHYEAGRAPDETQILQDAGAWGYDARGNRVVPDVEGYGEVDFFTPSDYHVYLEVPDEDGASIRKAVIIVVQ